MFQVVRSDMLKSFLHIVEDVGLYDDGKSKREKEVVSAFYGPKCIIWQNPHSRGFLYI